MNNWRVSALAMVVGCAAAVVAAQTVPPATGPAATGADPTADKPTLWLVGDSTMNNSASGGLGWGAPSAVGRLFDTSKITIQNRGRGGRSARSYFSEGLWDGTQGVLPALKAGDFVMVQFGHNDGGNIQTSANGRPDMPGIGDEMVKGRASNNRGEEDVHTYGWYLKKFVQDTKTKQATPIILTMVPHNQWSAAEGEKAKMRRTVANTYVKWSSEVAALENIYYINVNEITASRMEQETRLDVTTKYYTPPNDGTHTNPAGAAFNAQSVVMGIRALKDLKLNEYLSEEGKKLVAADAAVVRAPAANAGEGGMPATMPGGN